MKEIMIAIGFIIFLIIAFFVVSKFGWRYAGINELNRLEGRIQKIEKSIIPRRF